MSTATAKGPRLDRLQRLVDIVEKVPAKLFNMDYWKRKTDCGTVGCMFGHYAMKTPRLRFVNALTIFGGVPYSGSSGGFYAASVEFGIRYEDATNLFFRESYPISKPPSKRVALARVRRFIKKHQPLSGDRRVR